MAEGEEGGGRRGEKSGGERGGDTAETSRTAGGNWMKGKLNIVKDFDFFSGKHYPEIRCDSIIVN